MPNIEDEIEAKPDAPSLDDVVRAAWNEHSEDSSAKGDSSSSPGAEVPEVAQDRMIRSKKPWAVAAAAALLIGCTVSYVQYWRSADKVSMKPTYFGPKVTAARTSSAGNSPMRNERRCSAAHPRAARASARA